MNDPAAAWWRDLPVLRRFASHLLGAELERMRRAAPRGAIRPGSDRLLDDPVQDLLLDSLDLLQLSVALAGALMPLEPVAEGAPAAALPPAPHCLADWLPACQAALEAQDGAIGFRSSGSRSLAHLERHALSTLWQEARHLAALVGARERVLSAVPPHHVYGFLFTVLLPRALGGCPVQDVPDAVALAADCRSGDLVIGYPELWRALAMLDRPAPPGVVGITSTAPCPSETAIAVAARGIRLIEIFGSSETAGLGWRDDPDAAYAWFPWWQLEADGSLCRTLPEGGTHRCAAPDHLLKVAPGRFQTLGRRDQAVQVGGVNVWPARVEQILCEHPWVAQAAVRLMRPEEGNRLKAFVVPAGPLPEDWAEQLAQWIAGRLPAAERPVALRRGEALPRGRLGKLADWDA